MTLDKIIYLIGGLVFLLGVVAASIRRPDLRKLALYTGLIGAAVAPTEFLFTRDYWRPPVVLGGVHLAFEDFAFCFAITAFAALLYPAVMRRGFSARKINKRHVAVFVMFVLATVVAFAVGTFWLGWNSVVLCSGFLLTYSAIMWLLRPDLLRPSLITGGLMLLVTLVLYIIFFDVIDPGWWDRYWLLKHTRLGVTVFGQVPLSELAWYATWALFAGIAYPFVEGRKFVPLPAAQAKTDD